MKFLELGMYIAGLGLCIWFMANIHRMVDWLIPPANPRPKEPGHATKLAKDVNDSIRRQAEMDMKYAGVIKHGEVVSLRGDPETLQALARSEMAREIERQRREISRLRTENDILRRRDNQYRRENLARMRREYRIRRRPTWWMRLSNRLSIRWAVLMLGKEQVYGK